MARLGVDIGSISTKGVIIDDEGHVLAQSYIWTEGDPIGAVKRLARELASYGDKISSVGTTGSARRLIGSMLSADVVKNEITAHAVGTLNSYPEVRTILEIGGQDSKLILIRDGIVCDYAMNTLCAAGTGAFLSSQARRLGVDINELGEMAQRSANPASIAARCTVFAESDLVHKAQAGYSREDLVAGLCSAVAMNFLNNLARGKRIEPPIVFQGGVSKNKGVAAAFDSLIGHEVIVDERSHVMGAIGAALLSRNSSREKTFDFDIADMEYITRTNICQGCPNQCEIVRFYRSSKLLDEWGSRCGYPK